MPEHYMLLTDIGAARLANAQVTGGTVQLSEIALGDGGGIDRVPTKDRTALYNEVWRSQLNDVRIHDTNSAWIVCEGVVPPEDGPFWVREVGIFDSAGYLIAYGNYPTTYKPDLAGGAGLGMLIQPTLEVSATETVTITVDPSAVLATRAHVADQMADHEASRNHPDATEDAKGFVELATQNEVNAGTDSVRVVTPAALHARTATTTRSGLARLATAAEAKDGTSSSLITTPDGVRQAFNQYGLGTAAAGPATGVDALMDSGFWVTYSGMAGSIPGVDGQNGYLQHIERGNNNGAWQMWVGRDSGRMFTRVRPYGANTWGDWTEVWHGPNFPSLSDGAVAGYQRFPNGLLFQWGLVTGAPSSDLTWTFPTSFTQASFVVLGTVYQAAATQAEVAVVGNVGPNNKSSTTLRALASGNPVSILLFAIGR